MDFDEKVTDLLNALSHCDNADLPIILGGDFNIHEGESDFVNLLAILENINLSLASDPKIKTYVGPQGSSTPDHIFCSRELKVLSLKVVPRIESFHRPHELKVQIPVSSSNAKTPNVLDIDACKQKLNDLQSSSVNITNAELIHKMNEIVKSCKTPKVENTTSEYTHEIRLLRNEVREAFQLYQKHNVPFFKEVYLRCRSEFRRAILINKKRIADSKTSTLLENTRESGIRALYNTALRSTGISTSQVLVRILF